MAVFVLDRKKQPLMPCSEKRARLLLNRGRARVHKIFPFTIRLVDRTGGQVQPLQLKLDPGSKQTGIALVRVADSTAKVVILIELKHRGGAIRKAMEQRYNFRHRRRSTNLRYREKRPVSTASAFRSQSPMLSTQSAPATWIQFRKFAAGRRPRFLSQLTVADRTNGPGSRRMVGRAGT